MMVSSPYYSQASFSVLTPLAVTYCLASRLWVKLMGASESIAPLPKPIPTLPKQVAIVTGSNTGIGYETARSLAVDYGMIVVLACRSREKGEQAAKRIQRAGGEGAIFVVPLDLSSNQSITEFCQAIQKKFDKVHILVNNAGRNTSGDPVEGKRDLMFQTNFLGHFFLTAQLLSTDTLVPQARVVNLASVMHHFVTGNVNEVDYWRNCIAHDKAPTYTYSPSKLAAILFTIELNRRYPDRVKSIAVNPGGVNSDIWRDFPRFIVPLFALIYLNNQEGAHTSIAGAVCDWSTLSDNCNVPYLQPYRHFPHSPPHKHRHSKPLFPIFEMLGVFGGYFKACPRLPVHDNGAQAAKALWQAANEAIDAKWPTEA